MTVIITLSQAAQRAYPNKRDKKKEISAIAFRGVSDDQIAMKVQEVMDEFVEQNTVDVKDLSIGKGRRCNEKEEKIIKAGQSYIEKKKSEAQQKKIPVGPSKSADVAPTALAPTYRARIKRLSTSSKNQLLKPSFELLSEPLVEASAVENKLYVYYSNSEYISALKIGERLIKHTLYIQDDDEEDDLFDEGSSYDSGDMLSNDEKKQLKRALNGSSLSLSVDLKEEILRLMREDEAFKALGYNLVFDRESAGEPRVITALDGNQKNELSAPLEKMFSMRALKRPFKAPDTGALSFPPQHRPPSPPPSSSSPSLPSSPSSPSYTSASSLPSRHRPPPPPLRATDLSVLVNIPEGRSISDKVCHELVEILCSEKDVGAKNIQFKGSENVIGKMCAIRNNYILNNASRAFVEGESMPSVMSSQNGIPLPPLDPDLLSIQIRVPQGTHFSRETFKKIATLLSQQTEMAMDSIRIGATSAEQFFADKQEELKKISTESRKKLDESASENSIWRFMIDFMADNPATTAVGIVMILAGITAALIALGVITGGAGYKPFLAVVASFMHTTPAIVNAFIGVVGVVVAGLTTAGLSLSIFKHKSKEAEQPDNASQSKDMLFP